MTRLIRDKITIDVIIVVDHYTCEIIHMTFSFIEHLKNNNNYNSRVK